MADDGKTTDCSKAGGHYNPDKVNHGGPTDKLHHYGDFGNIIADVNGQAVVSITQ